MNAHVPTQAEIRAAQVELSAPTALAEDLPLDTPEWKQAVLICGDIEGWIVAAREWGLVRRSFDDALVRILELRQAPGLEARHG